MPIFALADCNNFYVSCERIFNPKLQDRPVIILSNNDGCVISRSNEAKALGIPMGIPYFKCKKFCIDNNVEVFSSNYTLYGDMSSRVMTKFKELVPEVETYSIDEAFLNFSNLPSSIDLSQHAKRIKATIAKDLGLPISIGIGSTKTLAKIANSIAKKDASGVFDLRDTTLLNNILSNLKVHEIWGVGKNIAIHLSRLGIATALQLSRSDPKLIRKAFGVIGEKMVKELNGVSCLELDTDMQPKKGITISRSFGRPVTDLNELQEAIADYSAKACEKMRAQNSKTKEIVVFISTYWHRDREGYYRNSKSLILPSPTDNTSLIIQNAKKLLQDIYKPNLQYKKVGIYLIDLSNQTQTQQSLFSFYDKADQEATAKGEKLMHAMDQINRKMGKGAVFHAAQGTTKDWSMKSALKSPDYTTNWDQLLKVS